MEATTEAGDNATTARRDDSKSTIGDVGGPVQGHDALPKPDCLSFSLVVLGPVVKGGDRKGHY
jgi:hypothetical protein